MGPKRACPECNLLLDAPAAGGVLTCPLCGTTFAAQAPDPPAPGRHVLRGSLAVAAVLALAGGVVCAYRLAGALPHRTTAPEPTADAPPRLAPPAVVDLLPLPPFEVDPPPRYRPQAPQPDTPRPPAPTGPPSLPQRVNAAIDRGVAHLRQRYRDHRAYRAYQGLLGLTLLECGAPADDSSIQQIAALIRGREADLTHTYELALAILFLDRLGDGRDRALIRTFGRRLLAGQFSGGGWGYTCPLDSPRRGPAAAAPMGMQMPRIVLPNGPEAPRVGRPQPDPRGDNSNTQFALLGLWVAQRHGVAARRALLAAEEHFRATQADDGSWSYHWGLPHWRDSMTCAGLMSLAMRHGAINGQGRDIRPDRPLRVRDRDIDRGLRFLGRALDKVAVQDGLITGVEARDALYFLWSLERLAVICDLRTVGRRDWYPWAAELLVETQRPDGGWPGAPQPAGTCFALLVLKRSNLAKDLQLIVQDPPPRRDLGRIGQAAEPRPLGPSVTRTPGGESREGPAGAVPELPDRR